MKRRALPVWFALGLAVSCAIPELRVDPDLDPDESTGGGTSGTGGTTGGTGAGGTGGATPTGGASGKGGVGGADGGKGGAATGGKAGAPCEDSGLTTCGGVCVNTDNDPLRCGSCDTRCTNGHGCSNGRCVCPSGYRECSGVCADLTSDRANCGTCGTPCDLPLTCTGGSCQAVMCQTLTAHVDLPQLDNFEDGDSVIAAVNGRVGYWWTYAEEVTNCVMSPVPTLPFEPAAGGPAGSLYAVHVASQGCMFAGLGCDLNNRMGKNCPLNVTAFSGIRFRYLSPTTSIRVQVGTRETLSVDFGGDCTADCDDLFGLDLPAVSTWTTATAAFSEFTQAFGGTMVFQRTGFMNLQFTAPAADGFDFWIDEITFY